MLRNIDISFPIHANKQKSNICKCVSLKQIKKNQQNHTDKFHLNLNNACLRYETNT